MNTRTDYLRQELEAGRIGLSEVLREFLLGKTKIKEKEYRALVEDYEQNPWRKAALFTQPALSRRRWTEKDDMVTAFIHKAPWPTIPDGFPYAGEQALRVWVETWVDDVGDGGKLIQRTIHQAPEDAILVSKLRLVDAMRCGLVSEVGELLHRFLYVPIRFWMWVGSALTFDKKVLLSLGRPLADGTLERSDAGIDGELVWISPIKKANLKYLYVVLPQVGMGAYPTNPGIFASIQADPDRHLVWEVIDEIIARGINGYGKLSAGRNGEDEIRNLKFRFINTLREWAAVFADREDFRRAGLNPDGSIPLGAVTYEVKYAWRDSRGRRHHESWQAIQGTLSLNAAIKVVESDRYRHLPEAERRARELLILEAGARNTIYNLRLGTEASALAGSGDVARLVDHLGIRIREGTSGDTTLHRQAFINAAWVETAAESDHLASVAQVARAIENHQTDPDNFSHPDEVAAKAVAAGKARPGTTAPQLVREAKKHIEVQFADTQEESLGFLGKLLPPRVARWLVHFLNMILGILERVALPLRSIEIFGRDAELGLLELFLAIDFLINGIARILWPLIKGLGLCWMGTVVVGGCLLFGIVVGNQLRNAARDRVWVKVVVLVICIVVAWDVLTFGHGPIGWLAQPAGVLFGKWVEINPFIPKLPTPTPAPTILGPTPTPATLPKGWGY